MTQTGSIYQRFEGCFTEMLSYFYVLYCKDGSLYGGYTTDLKRRFEEHNSGTGAKYTRPKTRRPLKMIYAEAYETKSEAMKAEYAFKQKRRPEKDAYLFEQGIKQAYKSLPNQPLVQDRRQEKEESDEETSEL